MAGALVHYESVASDDTISRVSSYSTYGTTLSCITMSLDMSWSAHRSSVIAVGFVQYREVSSWTNYVITGVVYPVMTFRRLPRSHVHHLPISDFSGGILNATGQIVKPLYSSNTLVTHAPQPGGLKRSYSYGPYGLESGDRLTIHGDELYDFSTGFILEHKRLRCIGVIVIA